MRWTFSQVDAKTLRVTSTARTNRETVAFSTNIPVPGAITGFMWFAFQMDSHTNRRSYYNNLNIAPIAPGGGALSMSNVFVRLASNAPSGAVSGTFAISSAGQALASVEVSGMVTTTSPYSAWAELHGLDPQVNGARGADPDNDGHSNLREFLFGGNPKAADGSLVGTMRGQGTLVFTFLCRGDGVNYKLLSATNLSTSVWLDQTGLLADSDSTNSPVIPEGYLRKQATIINPSGALFLRLEASEKP
jgi:hypothetical protein